MISDFPMVSKRLSSLRHFLRLFPLYAAASCAHVPPPSHFRHTAQEAALIPADTHLTMSDGASIPLRFYPSPAPQKPCAVILAFHGFGDSRDAWESMAPAFNAQNILIIAPDARGFGQALAPHQWSSTPRMIADAKEELAWVQQHWPHTPLYLMGESMGGATALLLAAQPSTPSSVKTILLAPATVDIGQPLQTILDGWTLLTPNKRLTGAHIPGHRRIATDNLAALRRMFFDPLTQHGTTVEALDGLTHLMTHALNDAPSVRTPVLLIYGSNDQFVPPFATRSLLQRLPSTVRFDSIDGAHHLLTRDKRGVSDDILAWMNNPEAFLPSGGDFAATQWRWLYETQ